MTGTEPNGRLEEALRNLRDDLKDILKVLEKNEMRVRKLEEDSIRFKTILEEVIIPLREPILKITENHVTAKRGLSWLREIVMVVLTIIGTLIALKMAGIL